MSKSERQKFTSCVLTFERGPLQTASVFSTLLTVCVSASGPLGVPLEHLCAADVWLLRLGAEGRKCFFEER